MTEVMPRYRFGAPRVPVVSDMDGTVVRTADELCTMLAETFDRPLDWPAVVATFAAHDVSEVYVTGPDKLFGRLDCTTANFRVTPVTPTTASRPATARPVPAAHRTG
jgi:[acyl-carrier-protein] S-malonyltransferase